MGHVLNGIKSSAISLSVIKADVSLGVQEGPDQAKRMECVCVCVRSPVSMHL